MTLYEITGQILELQEMMESGEFDNEVIEDTLESVMFDLENKADNYGKLIRNMEANMGAIKQEMDTLKTKYDRIKKGIERFKTKISDTMIATGLDEKGIEGDLFKFKFRNNAPQLPTDLTYDKVPKDYLQEQEPKIDKKRLLADVKAGKVQGNELRRSRTLQMT